ncbi:MAG: PAS domain-containing protein [Acetobacter sp.]|nr:PAS domain-containing protein [Acetobacter sp.]
MTIETITVFLYVWLTISLVFPMLAIWLIMRTKRCKRELEKQNLANKYYEEMLYASKDGYLTYSYYKNKEYQYCSRRLATLLNLKNGENSTLSEVLSIFERVDAEKINAFFIGLKRNGLSFETIVKTKNKKTFTITGTRINSADSEINSNCLWFRDITKTTNFIDTVTEEAYACRLQLEDYRILIDNIPSPIWLRNENLDITLLNRPYLKLLGLKDFKDITPNNIALHDLGNTTNLLELAKNAKDSNTAQKKQINILADGDLKKYEITEAPHYDATLKTTRTVGSLVDITGFDEAKRSYQVHLDSHLDILSSLDTAFCIINTKHIFTFGNAAFLKLWNLPTNFIDNSPHYNLFLDTIREKKTLPEVSDFKAYKEEENKAFDALTEQREDLLYIPDGRTFRRIRAPHPDGTLIAYEDISERLADARRLSDLISVQQGILDNISDSVVIFSPTLKLKTYNIMFLKMWELSPDTLETALYLRDLLNLQKQRLPEIENWQTFREDMLKHITACTPFTLKLKNKQKINVTPIVLPDTSLMITYRKQ